MKLYDKYLLFAFSFIAVLSSCNEDKIDLPISTEYLQESINIQQLEYSHPYLYAIGYNGRGHVFKRHVDSLIWEPVYDNPERFNCAFIDNEKLLLFSDSLQVLDYDLYVNKLKSQREYSYFDEWPKTISNFKKVIAAGNKLFYVSEIDQINGNVYWSDKDASLMNLILQSDQGLYDLVQYHNDSLLICGYGTVIKHCISKESFEFSNFSGNVYTGVDYRNGIFLMTGFNGAIYRKSESGKTWSERLAASKVNANKVRLNSVSFISDEKAIAVGEQGCILYSSNSGKTWARVKYNGNEKLISIAIIDNFVFISASSGKILKLDLH